MLMRRLFGSLAGNLHWPVLIILSGLFALVLAAIRLPAALLLGPMLAAILVAVFGTGARVPHRLFLIAQAVIGAASAMMLMAAAYGADIRLVAFMQYLRVLFVAVVATVFARLWTAGATAPTAAVVWFPQIAWVAFAQTVALIAFGAACARLRRIPAAPLLVPLGLGMALQDAGLVAIELPPWLLAISYTLVGWSIGLGFNRSILDF
jgi:uncharacterized membrane protein AbrB (regulator of aidB expression)